MCSKLICSLPLAFLFGLVILVCRKGALSQTENREAGPPSPVVLDGGSAPSLGCLGSQLATPFHPRSPAVCSGGRHLARNTQVHLMSQAPAFPCEPHMYPMVVSSVHESMILFYIPYSSVARGRNDRSYCFQKDCSLTGRPIYEYW